MTHSDDARREAERRYRCIAENQAGPTDEVTWMRNAFRAGVEWQASQPVTVTTEQVQAGAVAMVRSRRGVTAKVSDHDRDALVAALTALGFEVSPDV